MPGTVSIVGGTGALGFGLALRLARAGAPIVIGSRDAERAAESARIAAERVPEGTFEGVGNDEAARRSELVILSVPFRSQSETLTSLEAVLRPGQLVVDTTVPLAAAVAGSATHTLGVWQGSAAQQAQSMVPDGVTVVSALHTISAATLTDLDKPLDEHVLVCGDDRADKQRVIAVLEQIEHLRGVDCGKLEMARLTEQITPLLISISIRNKTRAGIKITGV